MRQQNTSKHRILKMLMRFSEVPLHDLMTVGGTSADRRIRELKEKGFEIEWRFREVNGERTNTTLYRLRTPREKIDYTNLRVMN